MTWHLLLDYDSAAAVPGAVTRNGLVDPLPMPMPMRTHDVIAARLKRAGYAVTAWSFEPSTNGWHAKVELDPPPTSPLEIVALQAVCGSDPSREACNVQRARELENMDVRALLMRLRRALWLRWPRSEWPARAAAGALTLNEMIADDLLGDVESALLRGFPAFDTTVEFYRDRWNTLYTPNPNRRKVPNGEGEHVPDETPKPAT
jgi:hypothetical protein